MAEHTFYHPEVGTWVAIDDVPPEILATYAEGTREIAPRPAPDYTFNGETWIETVYVPTLQEMFEAARQLVSAHINSVAQARGYDDAVSCASYIGSGNKAWAAEAAAFVEWRDSVWTQVFSLRDQAIAGTLAALPSADALIKGLPTLEWPKTG